MDERVFPFLNPALYRFWAFTCAMTLCVAVLPLQQGTFYPAFPPHIYMCVPLVSTASRPSFHIPLCSLLSPISISSRSHPSIASSIRPKLIVLTIPPTFTNTTTMAFTQFRMAPTLSGRSSLESMGSVAANFSRTDEEEEQADYIRFAYGCAESEFLLQVFGQAVHDDFIASVKAEKEKAAAEKRKRDDRQARCREHYHRFRAGFKDIFRSLSRRQI
ncbi:MAG: hypothetical protein Q9194_000498 [Teloschistes cf. exilis]